ncbi:MULTISPECIES: hypothetical protein [unclassified Stenotrophomonas]|uniref:hypothetical protein n=1 Tax=unclassified Stenotrophomonas TaxID=196198 RepID=UPI000D1540E4|nr:MULTISPECIES: hypothetical protein [unclassified Stenotrophomonas]PTA72795.1 hypothetical protein C9412_04950 [Stenotrophomonas sp. Nf1]PTA82380.1 hypothetical protein C9416_04110 [Stenotrophomonas sp. Nf4]
MRYLVVLDPQSTTSKCYASKGPDGTWFGQPCVVCSELDASHPTYLFAVRSFMHGARAIRQRIHFPHEAVAFVIEDEHETGTHIGFRQVA